MPLNLPFRSPSLVWGAGFHAGLPAQVLNLVRQLAQFWKPLLPLALMFAAMAAPEQLPGQSLSTEPIVGLHEHKAHVHAFLGAEVITRPGQSIKPGLLIIRDGVIEAVGPMDASKIPADAVRHELSHDAVIYPGFIDAFSEANGEWLRNKRQSLLASGAHHWNDLVTPHVNIAAAYQADDGIDATYRKLGICARVLAPMDGVIKGSASLLFTSGKPAKQSLIVDEIAQVLELTLREGGRRSYPDSPMGAVALARQTMYDARWYAEALRAAEQEPSLPRPEANEPLQRLEACLSGKLPCLILTSNELFALRGDAFAREFGLNAWLLGSGREYQRLEAIVALHRPIILPINFPHAPDVGTPEAARNAELGSLMHWEMAPENPARLHAAGVRFCFTTHGLANREDFRARVRQAIERGLPEQAALAALTTTPADLLGVSHRLGALDEGKSASFVISLGPVWGKDAKVLETWVDGQRFEVFRAKDALGGKKGELLLASEGAADVRIAVEVTGEAPELQGELVITAEPRKTQKLRQLRLDGDRLAAQFDGTPWNKSGIATLSGLRNLNATNETAKAAETAASQFSGGGLWGDGSPFRWTLSMQTDHTDKPASSEEKPAEASQEGKKESEQPAKDAIAQNPADKAKAPATAGASGEGASPREAQSATPAKGANTSPSQDKSDKLPLQVNYPFGPFGRAALPTQPDYVLVKNATLWTLDSQGKLEQCDMLIEKGKIAAIGKGLAVPGPGTVVEMDATNKHVTPGIIDCHSHIATDGGINEAAQAVTAEVRIEDFLDANDIQIYRQLAGGVTTINVLHGSANPIGGQNAVIKLRWGALPADLRMQGAKPGIKFALGENVKSNGPYGGVYAYPASRMGVEQVIEDAFRAADDYRQRKQEWKTHHRGSPPRVDLELEALAEVLDGGRLVHCHSYRQDEILAFLRTCERHHVNVATLQHILEGYKVAEVIAQHGAGGSSFSDWWAYKIEVYDAIPYNGAMMHKQGITVSFNSDDAEMARRLNTEAAKAVKYGGVPEVEALKFVTLNAAKQLHIQERTGSLEVGKDADFALWSGSPLSSFSRCEQTWIDGRCYFDVSEDKQLREANLRRKQAVIAKILQGDEPLAAPAKEGSAEEGIDKKPETAWPRTDIYCRAKNTFRDLQ